MRMRFKRRRLRQVALLPTLVTLANGICGVWAIMKIGDGINGKPQSYEWAAWWILLGMVFDVLDGKIARMTGTTSKFGGQLDSLCDLVTFGVAPAFLVKALCTSPQYEIFPERMVVVFSIFFAACSAIRLARFNIETSPDEKHHMEFAGLPTPAAAGVVASCVIPWSAYGHSLLGDMLIRILPVAVFTLGLLMVSRVRYMHVVNKFLRGVKPFATLTELSMAIILIILMHEFAIFIVFFAYAISGPIFFLRDMIAGREPFEKTLSPASEDPSTTSRGNDWH